MPTNVLIAELIPPELKLTNAQYAKAEADLERDGKFTKPAKIFRVEGHSHVFVRDGHHHIRAALEKGATAVPCDTTDPPADWKDIVDHVDDHLRHKGFATLPIVASRTENIRRRLRDHLSVSSDVNFVKKMKWK